MCDPVSAPVLWETARLVGYLTVRVAYARTLDQWITAAGTAAALERVATYCERHETAAFALQARRHCERKARAL